MKNVPFDRNFKWSFDRKLFSINGHLIEKSLDRKVIWPKSQLTENFFRKMVIRSKKVIRPTGHLIESVFLDQCLKKLYLTLHSIVGEFDYPDVFVATRHHVESIFFKNFMCSKYFFPNKVYSELYLSLAWCLAATKKVGPTY
jgi:hypothetical protein